MSADLGAVISEVATALAAVPELADAARRHTGTTVARVTPPAVIVEPAGEQVLDNTYGPAGMDLYALEVTLVVALLGAAPTWAVVSPFLTKSGAHSIKHAVENHDYTSCSAVTVAGYELVVVTFAGNQYLGATFKAEAGG